MINYYKTINNTLIEIDKIEPGCWVSVVEPTQEEIKILTEEYQIDAGFVKSSLDEEESSRVEIEEKQTLIIVDGPMVEKNTENTIQYYTMPMGIILTQSNVFTISLKENIVLSEIASGLIKNVQTHLKTQFVLIILLRIATRFLQYLKQIDKISSSLENQLHKSMKNKELIQILGLEKSLVYFSTSLKADEITLEKILRGRVIKLYDEDQDLLEDVLIEVKQAVEMSNIYSSILTGMMDAYGSIISNNVNLVMKRLTIITILMAIPTIVYSFYGMNVTLPFIKLSWWFPFGLSVLVTAITAFVLLKKDNQ
jgi:magnesium transporter